MPATTGVPVAAAGSAALHVIWSCVDSKIIGKGAGAYHWQILVDGIKSGEIAYCSHSTIKLSGGKHYIRVADPNFDLAGAFGNKGQLFVVPDSGTFHVRIQTSGGSLAVHLMEIDAARAAAEAKAIDSNR